MKKVFGNIFNRKPSIASSKSVGSNTGIQLQNLGTHKSSGSSNRQEQQSYVIVDITTPKLSQSSPTRHQRAIVVEASSEIFGNECLRLVNVVFQTSQTFQSIMGTYGNINQYLRRELYKKYPNEYFQIIIGENYAFGFAIDDDGDYFAEIEQEEYRVIIFTTRFDRKSHLTTHDTNSQMMLEWKLVKQSKK
jgi:hypothetical protein